MRQLIDFKVSKELRDACIAMYKAMEKIVFTYEYETIFESDIEWDLTEVLYKDYYSMLSILNLYKNLELLLKEKESFISIYRNSREKVEHLEECTQQLRSIIKQDCEYLNEHRGAISDSLSHELEWFTEGLKTRLHPIIGGELYNNFTDLVSTILNNGSTELFNSLETLNEVINSLMMKEPRYGEELKEGNLTVIKFNKMLLRISQYINMLLYPSKIAPITEQQTV